MKQILLLSIMLLVVACETTSTDYIETDKIQLLFYDGDGALDDKEKIIGFPEQVRLSIRMDIGQITQVVVRDVSSDIKCNRDGVLPSPSTLASFILDPKANIKTIDFRIRLPCAAYSREFYVMVKVKALGGNYFMRKRLPAIIDRRPGEGP